MKQVSFLISTLVLAWALAIAVAQEVMTNEDVVRMFKAGFSEEFIVQKIGSSRVRFDLSVDAIIKLKEAGLSDGFIKAMHTVAMANSEEGVDEKRIREKDLSLSGSETTAALDRWRGLVLNESSPDDAIGRLGRPEKDSLDKLKFFVLQNYMNPICKKKVFRVLKYKSVEGLDELKLAFYQDKLVQIYLDLKEKINVMTLEGNYRVQFHNVQKEWTLVALDDNAVAEAEYSVSAKVLIPYVGEDYEDYHIAKVGKILLTSQSLTLSRIPIEILR